MNKLVLIFIALFKVFSLSAQSDSLSVFFIGSTEGESFKVYWYNNFILEFKGNNSYKYSFKIPVEESWEKDGWIDHLHIYRKGRFGLSYKDLNFHVKYEPKKYLIIRRSPILIKSVAVMASWSDKEPLKPPRF